MKKSISPPKKAANDSNIRSSTKKVSTKEEVKSKGMNTTKTSNLSGSESGKNVNISPSKVKLDSHKEEHEIDEEEVSMEDDDRKEQKKRKKTKKKKQNDGNKLNDLLKIYGLWFRYSSSSIFLPILCNLSKLSSSLS